MLLFSQPSFSQVYLKIKQRCILCSQYKANVCVIYLSFFSQLSEPAGIVEGNKGMLGLLPSTSLILVLSHIALNESKME